MLYGVFPNPLILHDLRAENPDIIHLHGIGHLGNDFIALLLKRKLILLSGHGGGMFYRPDRPWYHWAGWKLYCELIAKKTVQRIYKIIVLTPYEIPFWISLGVPQSKIDVIPWGIPNDCFLDHNGAGYRKEHRINGPMLLFVGSLVPGKGAQWLVKAMPEILQEFPDVYAVICGPDLGYKRQLVTMAVRLRITEKIMFTDFLPRKKLLKAYAACDIFVMPSDIEGFGLSIAQAIAFGKPVVACRVGGVPYLVKDGVNGFLIPQRDFRRLADRIKLLLGTEGLRRQFGERGKMLSEIYSWNTVAQKHENLSSCA